MGLLNIGYEGIAQRGSFSSKKPLDEGGRRGGKREGTFAILRAFTGRRGATKIGEDKRRRRKGTLYTDRQLIEKGMNNNSSTSSFHPEYNNLGDSS